MAALEFVSGAAVGLWISLYVVKLLLFPKHDRGERARTPVKSRVL